jgi:GT2 family glycosyltransferase
MNRVAAVVVTYNRKDLLVENISALLHQTPYIPDVIVIDNNSTDGTQEAISDYCNQIIYINTGANLGGAGGFHFGIKKATEMGYDYLWIMDDDCIPEPQALSELLKASEKLDDSFGFLSSKVLWKDGKICTMNVQRETLTRNLSVFDDGIKQITMASFVSLFVKTDAVKQYGLPIKEFFIWTDDWEFTRRISRNISCYYVPDSVVIHKSNNNVGAQIYNDTIERLDRYNYLYRNDVFLYRREGFKGFCYEFARLSSHVLKVVFKAKDNKLKRIKTIFKGTKSGFSFNPTIEYVNKE